MLEDLKPFDPAGEDADKANLRSTPSKVNAQQNT